MLLRSHRSAKKSSRKKDLFLSVLSIEQKIILSFLSRKDKILRPVGANKGWGDLPSADAGVIDIASLRGLTPPALGIRKFFVAFPAKTA